MEMIFDVPIEGEGWPEIKGRLDKGERLWIVTANPEILLEAKFDQKYRSVLETADLRVIDGFGVFIAKKVLGVIAFFKKTSDILRRKTVRLTGVELAEHLVQMAHDKGLKVGLFGGEFGEAETAAKEIRAAYPGIVIRAEQGGRVERDGGEDGVTEEARSRMIMFGPQVLLVAMGHPRQEFWIAEHRQDFPEVQAIVGVGGTFNFWAGRIKRAPFILRAVGFEWFWRLLREPRRWKRIFRAVVVFPVLFIFDLLRFRV